MASDRLSPIDKPSREAWANAYATQARSDWQVYKRLLTMADIPMCHRLHYLQMACEKIAKAHRCRDTEADLDVLLSKHVGIESFIANYMAQPRVAKMYSRRSRQLKAVILEMRDVAREIELLAPAVDRARTPINAEYPWANGPEVIVPCESDRLFMRVFQRIQAGVLKIFEHAMTEF